MQARAHPNVLRLGTWLNNLYHIDVPEDSMTDVLKGVELSTPLSYADRFRIRHAVSNVHAAKPLIDPGIRHPGVQWNAHPPHIDGGGIERWVSIHKDSFGLRH